MPIYFIPMLLLMQAATMFFTMFFSSSKTMGVKTSRKFMH